MNIEFLTQPKLVTGENFRFGEEIIRLFTSKKPKYKKVDFMFEVLKANAIETMRDALVEFIGLGGEVNFYIEETRSQSFLTFLRDLKNIGCNIYMYNSADNSEFQYRCIIFTAIRRADIYISSGNLSVSGLYEAKNIITHIECSLVGESKKEYEDLTERLFLKDIFKDFVAFDERETTKNVIPTIESFTKREFKITDKQESNIEEIEPNIAIEIDKDLDFLIPEELPKKESNENKTNISFKAITQNIEKAKSKEICIPIMDYVSEPIYYGVDNEIDLETYFIPKKEENIPPIKTNRQPIKEKKIKKEVIEEIKEDNIQTKRVTNLNKISIFTFQTAKISQKGICAGEIKVPIYIRDLIPHFWEWPSAYKVIGEHSKVKSRICRFKIIDTANPSEELEDKKGKFFQRADESSFTISSKVLASLDIKENDIIRLIKTQDEYELYYTCEIIRQEVAEYPIWEQFCTQEFKNGKRKYGIM